MIEPDDQDERTLLRCGQCGYRCSTMDVSLRMFNVNACPLCGGELSDEKNITMTRDDY